MPTPVTPAHVQGALHSPAAGVGLSSSPRSHSESLFFLENVTPKATNGSENPVHLPQAQRGDGNQGTSILQEGTWRGPVDLADLLCQTLSAVAGRGGTGTWGVRRGGAAEGMQADKAVTKDSCKSSTKDL